MEERKVKGNKRRRERARKMRNEISLNAKVSEDSCDEMPHARVKPSRPKKRNKEPIFEEDIIDGFAVMAFRSYEDLERCVRLADKANSHVLDPYPNRVECEGNRKRRSALPKVNIKVTNGNRFSTEEEGYICDRESEGDKVSDMDDSMFSLCLDKNRISALSRSNALVENELPSIAVPVSLSIKSNSIRCDDAIVPAKEPFYTSPITTSVASSVVATTSTNNFPKICAIKEEPVFDCSPHNLFEQKPITGGEQMSDLFEDKKPPFVDHKFLLPELKPQIDIKPPLFSPINPCPQPPPPLIAAATTVSSTYGGALFRPHFNPVTTASPASTTATITPTTTTTTSLVAPVVVSQLPPLPPITYTSHCPAIASSQATTGLPSFAEKSRFSVSSLVAPPPATTAASTSAAAPPVVAADHSAVVSSRQASVIRPQIVKTFPPPKSPVPSVISKLHGGGHTQAYAHAHGHAHHHQQQQQHVGSSKTSTSSLHHGSKPPPMNGPFPVNYSDYVAAAATVPQYPHATFSGGGGGGHPKVQPPMAAYSPYNISNNGMIKLEAPAAGDYGTKPGGTKLLPPPKTTPPVVFAPPLPPPHGVVHPAMFGALPLHHSPHLKTHSSLGDIVKREPSNGTPPRPTTPHCFMPRYSPRMQDPAANLYSTPSSLVSGRLGSFPRPATPGSFPTSTPISAPLPPSGMFAPHTSGLPPQPLAAPPLLPPTNCIGQDPIAQADLLRRELDSRFLATQDRTAVGMPPAGLGSMSSVPTLLRADVHHHQHQHTHVHQHMLSHLPQPPPPPPVVPPAAPSGIFSHSAATPSLFKEVSKMGMENGIYHQRSGLGSFSTGISPLVPPSNSTPLVSSQTTPVSKKSGRWNVMHVRIAWEIFYDQQKQGSTKGVKLGPSDVLMRAGGAPSLYSSLSRTNTADPLGGSIIAPPGAVGAGGAFLTAPAQVSSSSVPSVETGFRYNSPFQSANITPSKCIPGPPPGSMFSRESASTGLSMPAPIHDPWRPRPPAGFGNAPAPIWHHKADANYYENERREQEERERSQRQKERKEREERQRRDEQERRQREEKEKREREERERRAAQEAEKQREREKRAEHEKERLARIEAYNERGSRRDESRSPLRLESHAALIGQHLKHDSRPSSGSKYDSSKDEITIVGSKEGTRVPTHPTVPHLGTPVLPPAPPQSFLGPHHAALSAPPLDSRARFMPPMNPAPMGHWPDPLMDPYRAASAQDPFAVARAHHDMAARESFLASRDHLLRDPLRDSIDRAREEHLMRVNPLGTMILNERYREHQVAREMIERERQYVAAATAAAGAVPGGLYSHAGLFPAPPPHPSMSVAASVLPPGMKTGSPLGHPPHMMPHPALQHHQSMGLYPTGHLGHPSLAAPGMPPPLISSLVGPGQVLARPPDKKDVPK